MHAVTKDIHSSHVPARDWLTTNGTLSVRPETVDAIIPAEGGRGNSSHSLLEHQVLQSPSYSVAWGRQGNLRIAFTRFVARAANCIKVYLNSKPASSIRNSGKQSALGNSWWAGDSKLGITAILLCLYHPSHWLYTGLTACKHCGGDPL